MNRNKKTSNWIIYIFLITIVILTIIMLVLITRKKEGLCNCFASQYNGSDANPNKVSYYGGICYDKEKITRLYDEGKFLPMFDGV